MRTLAQTILLAFTATFSTSSDRGRQYDHDRRNTRERNAHGSGVVNLFLFFDRRPSFLIQGDVSSRLLCGNPVVRDKNFRLVTSLAIVSSALGVGAVRSGADGSGARACPWTPAGT